jgi:hypothetical protein
MTPFDTESLYVDILDTVIINKRYKLDNSDLNQCGNGFVRVYKVGVNLEPKSVPGLDYLFTIEVGGDKTYTYSHYYKEDKDESVLS